MTRKLVLILGCLSLLLFTTAARADSITFSFAMTSVPVPVKVTANPGGTMTMAAVDDVVVKNGGGLSFPILDGIVTISSGNEEWYHDTFPEVTSLFDGGPAPQVLVTSLALCGGVCLSGNYNFGMYFGMDGDGGSWGGIYEVTYVSPAILALFGEQNWYLNPYGSDVFTTTNNHVGLLLTTSELGSGSITFQTYTPEPGTLLLLGSGTLGLARKLRRK